MRDKPTMALDGRVVAELRQRLRGMTFESTDPRYALSRRVWNAAIDYNPAAIVVPADAEDIALAVRVAADHGIGITVRGGGHNVAGRAVADGKLMLDLSGMRNVSVNAALQVASVEGGALWHDVDVKTAQHGMATTGGVVSSTGVGGLTLGGGAGWLMRRHGLTIDNLEAVGIVLPDGRFVRSSAFEHPDLFWAIRGGAGGFGVVTSFEFQLHPIGPVFAGVVIRPCSEAGAVLREFREFVSHAPDDFCGMVVLAHAPPLPFLDAAWYGRPVVLCVMCWSGDLAAGERVIEPMRRFGTPLADHIGPIPYVQWQHIHDPSAPVGRYQYWKTASFETLGDDEIAALAAAADSLPTRQTEIHIQHMGGAVARVPPPETAFSHRNAQFFVNFIGTTPWLDEFDSLRTGIRQLHGQVASRALRALLPNFSNSDDGDVTVNFAEGHAERIATIRRHCDPHGIFVRT